MNILSIRTVPDPVLRSKTADVAASRYGSPGLKRLIDSMHETMDAVEGVGLAAPQVTYLMHELRNLGIPVDLDAITLEEAKRTILDNFVG